MLGDCAQALGADLLTIRMQPEVQSTFPFTPLDGPPWAASLGLRRFAHLLFGVVAYAKTRC